MELIPTAQAIDYVNSIVLFSVKSALLLSIALTANMLLKRYSASLRRFILCATIVGIAALPLSTNLLPAWNVALVPAPVGQITASSDITPIGNSSEATKHPAQFQAESVPPDIKNSLKKISWPSLLAMIWVIGAAAVSLRLAGAIIWGWWLRGTAMAHLLSLRKIEQLKSDAAGIIGVNRNVSVRLSHKVKTPITFGIFRSVIILPNGATTWSSSRLNSVLMHEMAHIRNHDYLMVMFFNMLAMWQWFNPVIWLALKQLRTENEKASDDLVLAAGVPDVDYAQHLLDIGQSLQHSRIGPVAVAMASGPNLEERIMTILDSNLNRRRLNIARKLVIGLFVLILIIPLATVSASSPEPTLDGVSVAERDEIMKTLSGFYDALSNGNDYDIVEEQYIASEYFDSPELTFENLDKAVWRRVFDNTISIAIDSGFGFLREAKFTVQSIQKEDDNYILTQSLNIPAKRLGAGTIRYVDGERIIVKKDHSASGQGTQANCHLVQSLEHKIVMRKDNDGWKISQFNDGIAIMRMDTDKPFGPIFLIWIEDLDSDATPYGPMIFKVIPKSIVENAHNMKFNLEIN
jgi:beta-lactamase regulating signal transducer with metallopeptidase domain